ncbi:EAL domain-containing protein [Sphingomonas paeninsulae]|uniref:EAL domain-containing protein n=1 Tax=Sphingomonas paeninsulae TaxID=2319844 RepID=A0A494TPK9_SPHPE|nr:EAL domain-containing protein [Sphingomonas paeninsulae]
MILKQGNAQRASELRETPVGFAFAAVSDDPRFEALVKLGWKFEAPSGALAGMPKIMLIDLRKKMPPKLGAIAKALETARGAFVAIISDSSKSAAAFEAGATQIVGEPFDIEMMDSALLLAGRQIERLARAGGRRGVESPSRSNKAMLDLEKPSGSIQSELSANPTALMLIGLKRFDAINAAFGRQTGDDLLVAVERRIASVAKEMSGGKAIVSRSGGTDFIVIPGPMGLSDRLALAERIVVQIERPFMAGDHFVALGASIGIVDTRAGDLESDVLRRAQVALTAARDDDVAVRVLSAQDEGTALFDAGLETDLRRALDNNEIDILFQPQVSVTNGQIVGVEALARWQHPQHGELGAETLFSVAERSDYLTALSAHVQRRAAMKAAAWPEVLQSLRLSVNVTAEDIARPGFADTFLAMIDETGFPRDRLTVEITENGLIDDLAAAAALLATLRASGCRVAIDDFGTGYSSLAYLKALPLDYLKIDKHLAQDITGTARDRIVVRGVIDMARSLGLAVIAEGVETEEQLTLLAREGCNYYQGFLCAVPLGVGALADLVTQRSLPSLSTIAAPR